MNDLYINCELSSIAELTEEPSEIPNKHLINY